MINGKFLSVDPSLRNTAIVCGEIINNEIISFSYTVITTIKSNKKINQAEDLVNRCRELLYGVDFYIHNFKPDYCFGEFPSGSQNAAGMKSYGISCAILSRLPVFTGVTPMDVKKIVGTGVISKDAIIKYVDKKYSFAKLEKNKNGDIIKERMEHVCDAVVIAEAGINKLKNKI
jgi:hypothetical protein